MANLLELERPASRLKHRRPPLQTITAFAEELGVSERTVRRWIEAGELRAIRLGRLVRIRPEDAAAFLDRHTTATRARKAK